MTNGLRTTVEQASLNAFVAYLKETIGSGPNAVPDGIEIEPRWPDPSKDLPERALTVFCAGDYEQEWADPELVEGVDPIPGDDGSLTYMWHVCEITQPLQMDVWTAFDTERDDILARLQDVLNVGTNALIAPVDPLQDPVQKGVTLNLLVDDGWGDTIAEFTFGKAHRIDDGETADTTKYRAMVMGEVAVGLSVRAKSWKMARIIFLMKYKETRVPLQSDPVDQTITVTDSS